MFIHTVYFWLKPHCGPVDRDLLLRDCRDSLAKIPTVRSLHAGAPAQTPHEVVDNSYGVGLTVIFDDQKGGIE